MKLLVLALTCALGVPAGAERHVHKPSAPVQVTLESVAEPAGHRVTLVAIPTRAVPRLELALDGQRVTFPATAAGQRRELVVRVPAARARTGVELVGVATAAGRTRAATLGLGTVRAAPRPVVIRTLPDGRRVSEVR